MKRILFFGDPLCILFFSFPFVLFSSFFFHLGRFLVVGKAVHDTVECLYCGFVKFYMIIVRGCESLFFFGVFQESFD